MERPAVRCVWRPYKQREMVTPPHSLVYAGASSPDAEMKLLGRSVLSS